MMIADAQQEMLDNSTLTLEIVDGMYFRAFSEGRHFVLGFVKLGKFSCCLVKETDWQTFCRKFPYSVKEDPCWVKGAKTENDTSLFFAQGSG